MVHHMGNITKVTMNLPQNVIMKLHVGQLSISGIFYVNMMISILDLIFEVSIMKLGQDWWYKTKQCIS